MADPFSTIAVAFRVAQFVSSFSRRVRTRTDNRRKPFGVTEIEEIQDEFCSEWKRLKVFGQYLDRQPKTKPTTLGFRKDRVFDAGSRRKSELETIFCEKQDSLEELLHRLSRPDEAKHSSLSYLAKHDKAYFKHGYICDLRGRRQIELVEMLALVSLIMRTCTRQGTLEGGLPLCSGKEISRPEDDDAFIANLMHALLCLESDLLCAILDHILNNLEDWQRSRALHIDIWFSIFPRARHPLSTTWPWSIKPSLAVLWGVCWMFYCVLTLDKHFNVVEAVSGRIVLLYGQYSMDDDGGIYVNGRIITDASGQFLLEDTASESASPWSRTPTSPHAQAAVLTFQNFLHTQPQLALQHVTAFSYAEGAYNVATAAPDAWVDTPPWVSTEQIGQAYPYIGLGHPQPPVSHEYAQDTYSEQNLAYSTYMERAIVSANPLHQQRREISSNLDPGLPITVAFERNMSDVHSFRPINTEMSSGDIQDLSMPLSLPRGSSLLHHHTDADSPTCKIDDAPISPPSVTPERNEKGQRVCTVKGCTAPPFARQCEYKKHIDRHQRPYVCENPECKSLRGFTYKGGLHRHQREVHQTETGLRGMFYCSAPGCKRHTHGFPRRENMEEHVRRIHKKKQPTTSPDGLRSEDSTEHQHNKRKRCTSDSEEAESETDVEELRREVKRLKEEVSCLKERLEVKTQSQSAT